MKEITIRIDDDEWAEKAQEIFNALVSSGGLWGVKGGKTILHFDALGVFQGVELDYWPWRKRKEAENQANGSTIMNDGSRRNGGI